jgi:hypothetical protein
MNMGEDEADRWTPLTPAGARWLADTMERYGATTLGGLLEIWRGEGVTLHGFEFGPVEALVRAEMAYLGVDEDSKPPHLTVIDGGMEVVKGDEKPRAITVRWSPSALAWGLAHPEVHGLGEALANRVKAPSAAEESVDGDALATHIEDDRETYIINASESQIGHAQAEVNHWIADRPHGTEFDADDFQKAFVYRRDAPEGGDDHGDPPDHK